MLKFKSITGFRTSAAKLPALKNGEPIYLCVHFTNDIGEVVHKAVVTAEELAENFKGHCWGVTITGYRTTEEVAGMTLDQRGLSNEAPLVKPKNVSAQLWETLDRPTQEFVIGHEKLHEELLKAISTSNDIYLALLNSK
jgi:hypothetical protein